MLTDGGLMLLDAHGWWRYDGWWKDDRLMVMDGNG